MKIAVYIPEMACYITGGRKLSICCVKIVKYIFFDWFISVGKNEKSFDFEKEGAVYTFSAESMPFFLK